jgi:hypothetical protein
MFTLNRSQFKSDIEQTVIDNFDLAVAQLPSMSG